jgi:hypothetical protein
VIGDPLLVLAQPSAWPLDFQERDAAIEAEQRKVGIAFPDAHSGQARRGDGVSKLAERQVRPLPVRRRPTPQHHGLEALFARNAPSRGRVFFSANLA